MKKFFLLIFFLFTHQILPQGKVYLVIGSDTAIWDGMDVAKYNCYYNVNVIPDNTKYFFEVMQSAYRNKFSDSFGGKLKLTWWLMCGNIFRYADNKNMPLPNVMVPYIAKKYYGNQFNQFNDELSLHYHTFVWTDYDGDGKFWWNQAKNFNESKDDFYVTLAQLLIEENIFPVSFRSGWNTMDNIWQAELDKILPFSMHSEVPAFRVDNIEPIDNVYDWRLASTEFIPFKPSPQNYQLKGNGKGWNLRSNRVAGFTQTTMNDIFNKAKTKDQIVCLWGHVWDDQFPVNVFKIDSLAKKSAALYPTVQFKYCTAVEAMQLWMKNNDRSAPSINLQEITAGDKIKFKVQTDEQIFQSKPFMGIKFINETFQIVDFVLTGNNEWMSNNEFYKNNIVKAGVAVCDSTGNLSKKFVSYLQDDIYVDNNDIGYSELNGTWLTENSASWGLNSRKSILQVNDSSKARWQFNIDKPHYYNIFVQIPKVDPQCTNVSFRIYANNQLIETKSFSTQIPTMDWIYISTVYLNQSANNFIEMSAAGINQSSKILSADVVKISPLVRQRWLYLTEKNIDFGQVVKRDTTKTNITISNNGIEILTITEIYSKNNFLSIKNNFPIVIPKFSKIQLQVNFYSADLGKKSDTLFVKSDDPFNPIAKIAFNADVTNYFKIVDNEETNFYQEFGTWSKSNAQAYGKSSRYAALNQTPRAYSIFTTSVSENALYNISFIVPKTVNASNKALYIIQQENKFTDSIYTDQNLNSGSWVIIKNRFLTIDSPIQIKIVDDGKSTAGSVLRADAVKIEFTSYATDAKEIDSLPNQFELYQNYPNPFNPTTIISWQLPVSSFVTLKIYDLLGREVASVINEFKPAGRYNSQFSILNWQLSSGIYFYRLQSGNYSSTRKMILMK